jgi:hypothetical protein
MKMEVRHLLDETDGTVQQGLGVSNAAGSEHLKY